MASRKKRSKKRTTPKPRIYIKPKNRGKLRKKLGAKKGKKITAEKLADKPGDSKATKKQKNFARNSRKWRKK